MTIKVFQLEESENPKKFENDDDQAKKEIKSVDFCQKTTNFRQQQQNTVDEKKSPIAFSENYFKVNPDRRQSVALSEKDFQDSYSITKLQSDNIIKSSRNYLIKNYKPNKICKYFKKLKYYNFYIKINVYRYD
jgi:hypothetical protein